MKVVADTNVVAYYLLKTEPLVEEARRFWRAAFRPMAPAFWKAEFANVLWAVCKKGSVTAKGAYERLRLADLLGVESVEVTSLWAGALARSLAADHPVYDTLFVELAEREGCPLATFDQKLLKKFPEKARRPRDV